jgi:hypothetical protein
VHQLRQARGGLLPPLRCCKKETAMKAVFDKPMKRRRATGVPVSVGIGTIVTFPVLTILRHVSIHFLDEAKLTSGSLHFDPETAREVARCLVAMADHCDRKGTVL